MNKDEKLAEIVRCCNDPAYFIDTYVEIYDAEAKNWIPFKLWPEQRDTLDLIIKNQRMVILKARQLGLTWLNLAYALHQMIFEPIADIMIFSRREKESIYLLGNERFKGMLKRLPDWMTGDLSIEVDSSTALKLSNESIIRAFPTSAGDSYTATFLLVDEADLADDLGRVMGATEPAIDAGGKMVLLSRSNKKKPNSLFKNGEHRLAR
jgi:hypothetical protein